MIGWLDNCIDKCSYWSAQCMYCIIFCAPELSCFKCTKGKQASMQENIGLYQHVDIQTFSSEFAALHYLFWCGWPRATRISKRPRENTRDGRRWPGRWTRWARVCSVSASFRSKTSTDMHMTTNAPIHLRKHLWSNWKYGWISQKKHRSFTHCDYKEKSVVEKLWSGNESSSHGWPNIRTKHYGIVQKSEKKRPRYGEKGLEICGKLDGNYI